MECTCEDIGVGAHGATNEHRLACQLVVHRDEGMVRREGPSGSLAMHQELLHLAIYHVFLHLHSRCVAVRVVTCRMCQIGSMRNCKH